MAHPTPGRIRANLKNNVYLPTVARRYGTFDNREARYLGTSPYSLIHLAYSIPPCSPLLSLYFSSIPNPLSPLPCPSGAAADTVIVNSTATSNMLWARIGANLPRTPGSLYESPYIANTSAWDVRYVSFSSFSRALPLRSYDTLSDRAIRRHYADVENWDGRFTIWIGPQGAPVPIEATLEKGTQDSMRGRQGGGSKQGEAWYDIT